MKKIITLAMLAITVAASAQETYESAAITDKDLGGTARYIGMGGAMDALGADISTISSNPAGIALFRSSQMTMTGGVLFSGTSANPGQFGNKTNPSFDQIGIVLAIPNDNGNLNLALNFHKSKNFNQVFAAQGLFPSQDASLGKLAWMDGSSKGYTQIDKLYGNVFLDGNKNDFYTHASGYDNLRVDEGYVGNYDFNLSYNSNDRLYLGFTLGIKDMRYSTSGSYLEDIVSGGYTEVVDYRTTMGTGFDFTFGAIFRPVEASPFRLGLTIATPTFYSLTTSNDTYLYNKTGLGITYNDSKPEARSYYDYDFRLNTPWRFAVSAGTTIGNNLAIGAVYEYSSYSALDNRYYTNNYGAYDNSRTESDAEMNRHTSDALKGVHTVKLGLEYKPVNTVALRLGYNYLSAKYDLSASKIGWIDSWGSECASRADYVNWKGTNRITAGVGFQLSPKWFLDLAYQYNTTSGEFHPFCDSTYGLEDSEVQYHTNVKQDADGYYITNYADPVKISNNRHQLSMTLGFRF